MRYVYMFCLNSHQLLTDDFPVESTCVFIYNKKQFYCFMRLIRTSMMVENNDKKLTSLQVVRGIAALLVVFFHYRFFLKDNGAMTPDFWEQLLSLAL
ncbi:hypothetical protein O0544_17650 [Edwardsiella anguillarum]|nr:hypothetical protein [Edwardsiella anguillarum]